MTGENNVIHEDGLVVFQSPFQKVRHGLHGVSFHNNTRGHCAEFCLYRTESI
jgi:hypothetical protein